MEFDKYVIPLVVAIIVAGCIVVYLATLFPAMKEWIIFALFGGVGALAYVIWRFLL